MRRVPFLCLFLLLTGCATRGETDSRPIPAAWTADVQPMVGDEPGGFATVTVLPDGGTRANLTLRGGTPDGGHPWRIRSGRCPEGDSEPGATGDEMGDPGGYPMLQANERGNASGTASLPVSLDADGEYHVDVYASADDMSVVACGNLVRTD